MSIYAIGDVQGCLDELKALLKHIAFNPANDVLWFTGDLVNRGPQSLATLRFVKALGDQHHLVLGNHDLHLLAMAHGAKSSGPSDTLDEILNAPDRKELLTWLQHKPLLHDGNGYVMTHAGLAPAWTVDEAKALAKEVEQALQTSPDQLLQSMYGNQPDQWNHNLTGDERTRCILNYFTRMRYCYADGRLELTYKGTVHNKPADLFPWFDVPNRANKDAKIIFGHWASLNGMTETPNIFPLDTGCVWGNRLTAMRLEDRQLFTVNAGSASF